MKHRESYFSRQPIDEQTSKLTAEDILTEIKASRIHLMQIFWLHAFEHIYAYQIPIVHLWLQDTLIHKTKSIENMKFDFSNVEADAKNWFVYRQTNVNLFGPLAWKDLLVMKKNEILRSTDICFSIKDNSFLVCSQLPEVQIFQKEKEQPFYFQRRERRYNDLSVHKATVQTENVLAEAQLYDFSERGASIVSTQKMNEGDIVELSFYSNHSGKDILFKHNAKIRSVHKTDTQYRYGLFLLDKATSTLEQIRNNKKTG